MGKLKDGLNALQVMAMAIEDRASKVPDALDKLGNNAMHFTGLWDNGYDQLYLYLNEKLKTKPRPEGKKAMLKDLADSNVQAYVKNIEEARSSALKWVGEWKVATEKEFGGLFGDLSRLESSLAELGKHLDKKKKKLLVSKKYKDKLGTYTKLLNDLVAGADERRKQANFVKVQIGAVSSAYLEKTKLSSADTVETIESRATMGTRTLLEQYESGKMAQQKGTLKFRDQSFAKGIATIKQWIGQADEIEKEAPEW